MGRFTRSDTASAKFKRLHKPMVAAGFTIIEVLVVLAVAGLIMTVIFKAIPQLQRGQRDSQRKGITTRLKSELEAYASNSQGIYPFTGVGTTAVLCNTQAASGNNCGNWFSNYVNNMFNITDPSSRANVNIYYDNTIATPAYAPNPWTPGNVYIIVGGRCNSGSVTGVAGDLNSKQYAMMTALQIKDVWYCVDNF